MPSWKKIIVSGSNAELNQLTATSYGGNISGSATSTGSFGAVSIDGSPNIHGLSNAAQGGSGGAFGFNTATPNGSGITIVPGNDGKSSTALTNSFGLAVTHPGTNGAYSSLQINTGVGKVLWVGNDGNIEMPAPNAKISGSSTSTGSFGKLLGDGSSLTGVSSDLVNDTSPQLGENLDLNSNNITGTGNIDILGTITAQNFIVSSSVTSIEYQSISGSTIFGDTADDTHQFTGSINVSGSVNLDKNSHFQIIQPGGGTFKILTTGNQTSIEGGNITLTSGQGLKATKFQSNEINTHGNSKDAIDIGEGYIPGTGMRWGYVEILSNSSKTFTAGEAQLTVNSGSFEGIKIVGNQDQAADYLRIQSGSSDILNITHNGSVSGSSTSTGSFGHLELANRDTDAIFEFGRAHIGHIGFSDMAGFSHVDNDSTSNFKVVNLLPLK